MKSVTARAFPKIRKIVYNKALSDIENIFQ